jgi:hypothetical protein
VCVCVCVCVVACKIYECDPHRKIQKNNIKVCSIHISGKWEWSFSLLSTNSDATDPLPFFLPVFLVVSDFSHWHGEAVSIWFFTLQPSFFPGSSGNGTNAVFTASFSLRE